MNNLVESFIKKAQAAGLTLDQAEQFLTENIPGYKTAAQQVDDIISGILSAAGVEKTTKTAAYVEGFLTTAINNGATDEQAIQLAKQACDAKCKKHEFPPIPNNVKKASDNAFNTEKFALYSEGFMKRAQEAGLSEGQSLDLLKVAVAKAQGVKTAEGELPATGASGGLDIQALIAQLLGQAQQGGGDPAAAANPDMFRQLVGGITGGQGQPSMASPGM